MSSIQIKKKGSKYLGIFDNEYKFLIKYNPNLGEDTIHWDSKGVDGWTNRNDIEVCILREYLKFRKDEK